MNLTGFWRMAWKEYRAVRAFWLSMVVLIVLLQVLVLATSASPASGASAIFNLAIGAPAFFALGCAGAAFAVEREEGTYDFLRAAPIPAPLVLASKLAVSAAATAALLAVLWGLASVLAPQPLAATAPLGGLMGLWLVAAAEAIAWGTLFSLLMARPLVAICLALLATSTTVHLSAWSVWPNRVFLSDPAPYLAAVPRRAMILGLVLAVDVLLGLRWLDGETAAAFPWLRNLRGQARRLPFARFFLKHGPTDQPGEAEAASAALLLKPGRGTVIGRLLWQHFRQSGRLMVLMTGLFIGLSLLVMCGGFFVEREAVVMPLAVMAAIAGSCVFLADQEQRRYRFFVEHNVPPRWVWFTRQVPWSMALATGTFVVCLFWVNLHDLLRMVFGGGPLPYWQYWGMALHGEGSLRQYMLGVTFVVVAYAAGQWASMTLRSGLIAGFVGVVLAGALCGWAALIGIMQESWLLFVWPIPLVLIWATWLKAPDWIRENTTAWARARAAAAVVLPAVVLVSSLAAHRVTSIAIIDPGFDVQAYQAEITPEARATAEMYYRAADLYVMESRVEGEFSPDEYLEDNAESLALILEASRRPTCVLDETRRFLGLQWIRSSYGLIRLLFDSALQLQREGKLDDALDRYFTILKVISHWTDHSPWLVDRSDQVQGAIRSVMPQLAAWAARKGQTAERIKGAIERLSAVDDGFLHLDDGLKSDWVLLNGFLCGNRKARETLSQIDGTATRQIVWLTLMPWEKYRELRQLNFFTGNSLKTLDITRGRLQKGESVVQYLPPNEWTYRGDRIGNVWIWSFFWAAEPKVRLVEFEERKRATLILLALEAYRLDHGRLPDALDELVGSYLKELPLDPYAGRPFLYFPAGMAIPGPRRKSSQVAEAWRDRYDRAVHDFSSGVDKPAIWSTGPMLLAQTSYANGWEPEPENAEQSYPDAVHFRERDPNTGNFDQTVWPTYSAWAKGHWFEIPPREGEADADENTPSP